MALSGSISTGIWSMTDGRRFTVSLDWTATQSIENNSSTINWKLVFNALDGTGWVQVSELRVKFAGEQIYYRSHSEHTTGRNGVVLASGSKVVGHNADGTKSFTASVEAGIYQWAINRSGSGTIALDTIARASSVSCTTANIGEKPTITITRASSSFTHTLRYKYGTLEGTIVTKTTATSYSSWTIPTSFYALIPDKKNGMGIIYCDTYSGNTLVGTKTCFFYPQVSEASSNPTLNPTVEDTDAAALALTGDKNKLIRYYSDAKWAFNAAARNSATLTSIKMTNGGNSTTSATGTFSNVENGEFNFIVTDSRGFTVNKKITKTVIPYVKLTCDIWQVSADVDGNVEIGISGNCFIGSFGAKSNSITVQYRYKTGSGSYGSWVTVAAPTSGNTYETRVSLTGFDYQNTYTFQARVTDQLTNKTSVELPVRCLPIFDWGEDDFNVNVPFNLNGHTVLRHNRNANNTVLSASGGFIYFRPAGTDDTSNEIKFNPQGSIELNGDIIINGKSLKSILKGLGVTI